MTANIILAILAALVILEGLFVLLSPKTTKSMLKQLARSKNLQVFGIIEILVGLAILVFAVLSY